MIKSTGSRRDAASTLFNLPDFRVIDAADEEGGGRRVLVESSPPSRLAALAAGVTAF